MLKLSMRRLTFEEYRAHMNQSPVERRKREACLMQRLYRHFKDKFLHGLNHQGYEETLLEQAYTYHHIHIL